MANYIYPAPGVANVQATLSLTDSTGTYTGSLSVPSLQDITVNNSNDVFTWTQLDNTAKLQVATTATNSVSMNLVLDKDSFFGNSSATAGSVATQGIFNLSKNKIKVGFSLYMGDISTGANGPTMTGNAYVTGLAPTVSADSPVWVSPITLTVTGDYSVS